MSGVFDSIKLGLQEAINHAKGHEPDTHIHRPPCDPALVGINVIAHNPKAVIDALAWLRHTLLLRPTITTVIRHLDAVHESGITHGKPSRAMDGA